MLKSLSRSPTTSIDFQPVKSFYVPKKETCFDSCYPYFYYYCCCKKKICSTFLKQKSYNKNIIIKATAVLDNENFEAKIPTAICAGLAVNVLYNNKVFVKPYDVKILFIIVSRA